MLSSNYKAQIVCVWATDNAGLQFVLLHSTVVEEINDMSHRCGHHRDEQQNTNSISVKQFLQTDKTVHATLVSVKFSLQDLQISNPFTSHNTAFKWSTSGVSQFE